jgi:hypothetical protein
VSNKSRLEAQAIEQSVSISKPVPSPTQVIPEPEVSKGAQTTQGLSPETLKLLAALRDSL